jgi:hypothetical protein
MATDTSAETGLPEGLDRYGRLTRLDSALVSFLADLKAINRAFLLTSSSIDEAGKEPTKQFARDLAKYTKKDELNSLIDMFGAINKNDRSNQSLSIKLNVPPGESKEHRKHIEDFFGVMKAGRLVKRSFIFTLIGQYDAFVGNLIRSLLQLKPDILNGSERALSFSQLSDFTLN